MARTVEHYRRLGFTFWPPDAATNAGVGFAIASRDGIELHFAVKQDHDPARTGTWVYISVEDADVLHQEFEAAGAGQGRPVQGTDYRARELAHIDPDGNLILFGSRIPESAGAAGPPAPSLPTSDTTNDTTSDTTNDTTNDTTSDTTSGPAAFQLLQAVEQGDVERLARLLEEGPDRASWWINSCSPLHQFADAPGHRPNAAGVVQALAAAGADLNAHARDTWHHETPLHWAASNDDVELIDALLDAGADIEHPGSSIDGGPPIQSALGYAQWAALRRLWQRGAPIGLSHAAVLGLMDVAVARVEADPPPDGDAISVAFWNACRAGQLAMAQYLFERGAQRDWPASWDGATPLDAALGQHQHGVVAWLRHIGARGRP
jgi:uncharacterized protein